MSASSEPAWATWLRGQMDARDVSRPELTRRSEGAFSRDRLSKWLNGTQGVEAEAAILAADLLGASRAEALKAAGYDLLAKLLSDGDMEPDPMVARIQGWTHLTPEVRAHILRQYRQTQSRLRQQAQQQAEDMAATAEMAERATRKNAS